MAKVDAHVITAEEYDEIPELTDEMLDRAVFSRGEAEFGEKIAELMNRSVMRLDQDVADALQTTGGDWQRRANELIREGLRKRSA